jgi:hypothetical protein
MRKNLILLGFVVGLVAACSGSTATGAPPANGTPPAATQAGVTQVAPVATDTTAAGAPKVLDACKLITADEAAAVLGKPVDPGQPPEPGSSSCLFTTTGLSIDSIEITVLDLAEFKPTQKSITGLTITQVSGIGDDAYYISIGGGHVVLNVRKGQSVFSASVLLKGVSDSQLMASEKSLATLILGRI